MGIDEQKRMMSSSKVRPAIIRHPVGCLGYYFYVKYAKFYGNVNWMTVQGALCVDCAACLLCLPLTT
jgi:hypothetical protein